MAKTFGLHPKQSRVDSRRLIRRHIREVRTGANTYLWLNGSEHVAVLQPTTEENNGAGAQVWDQE